MKNVATWMRDKDVPRFAEAFAFAPEVRLWDARTEKIPWEKIHGLLLTGGEDISPAFLHQPVPDPSIMEDEDPVRDGWEFPAVHQALAKRLPILAICRGHQVLNVALGGTLHLHIPGHGAEETEEHNIQPLLYTEANTIQVSLVNSHHHQAIDRPGAGLKVEATCTLDGIIEQVRLADYPYCLGVQYHPERDDKTYREVFRTFVEAL